MTSYTIANGSIRHVKPMSAHMRMASCMAVQSYGEDPRSALRRAFVQSHHIRTAMVDGKPVAMWGIAGPLLGEEAYVWLVISRDIEKVLPIAIVKEAKAELSEIAHCYAHVGTTCLPEDEVSVRFAKFLGFKEIRREPVGDQFVVAMRYDLADGD